MNDLRSFATHYSTIRARIEQAGLLAQVHLRQQVLKPTRTVGRSSGNTDWRRLRVEEWLRQRREKRMMAKAAAMLAAAVGKRNWRRMLAEECQRFGVPQKTVLGHDRHKLPVACRQEIMLRMHLAGYSYPEIGQRLGGRDHTTILHGVRKLKRLRGLL